MSSGYVSEIFSSFQGEGLFAGRRHLFLRMAGCNLRCGYCDTPESLVRTPHCAIHGAGGRDARVDNPLSVDELYARLAPFYRARGLHALAITGGEPLLQADFLADLLRAHRPPVPVLLETNGTYPDRLRGLLPWLDIVSMDVKLPSNSGERELWAEHAAFLRESRGKTVYVKVPVDDETSDDEVRTAARLVAGVEPRAAFFLQPIVSAANVALASAERLERFYDAAVDFLEDVRVLPQAHKLLGVR